jgi:DNA-binding beta-propeller fold protein YncE
MTKTICAAMVLVGTLGVSGVMSQGGESSSRAPIFEVDPSWPKLPAKWVFGEITSIAIDSQDHAWALHRPGTVYPHQKGRAAPPVVEFDANGNFVQAWGGPGEGYEWPTSEHGIYVDHRNFVWVTGNADDMILKFTKAGKFVLQIGKRGQNKGNTDTRNVGRAADVVVNPKTNEVFVADGYGNRRVIVFDGDTGAFKRMWGAYGNVATDPPAPAAGAAGAAAAGGRGGRAGGPPPDLQQFRNVHGISLSNDGLIYVADRQNMRFQVFTPEGKFLTEAFVRPDLSEQTLSTRGAEGMWGHPVQEHYQRVATSRSSVGRVAFSPDPEQRYLYVADRSRQRIVVMNRKTFDIIGTYGQAGQRPGEFFLLHHIATDSKGNLYTAECDDNPPFGNRRVQKLVLNGLPVPPIK